MLINDLHYFKRSANYQNKTSGIDHPDRSRQTIDNWHAYPIQDFDYQFNSWGFRGPEYEQFVGKSVNICLGDSFTVNLGGPIEHSWCSQLAEHFDIPTLNLGMDGAGNDAIRLVYDRACEIFDVQNTFVMYSFLHRRLNKNLEFVQDVNDMYDNFDYFVKQRIPTLFESALPYWCWTTAECSFLKYNKIFYYLDTLYFFNYQTDRKFIDRDAYNCLKGPDWPTLEEFVQGADPHPDMLTKKFGKFISIGICTNRDGFHMNKETNKIYADYFYNQWKQKNES